ncbi:hypothetical protein pkur_cds_760 [Pandoravirus kuranda]|uniref:Uncharacterized protein n=1 Tax=Pandoravirus kuranda TaxID=3019033 RepID=A0AA95EJ96_9VIRU|nr:hypothetical protein pkur_cds_760 [Pandoravirus kuranda]
MHAGAATAAVYARNADRSDDGDSDVEAQDTPHVVVGPSRWQSVLRRFTALALVISCTWCINALLLGEAWPRATTVCGDLVWLALWSLWEHRRAPPRQVPIWLTLRRRRPASTVRDLSATATCRLA